VAFVLAFVQPARKREDALIDVRLFAKRIIEVSALTTFLFATAFFGLGILMPLHFQIVRGQSTGCGWSLRRLPQFQSSDIFQRSGAYRAST